MAEESKIKMKLEQETKDIGTICERLTDAIKHELDKGVENIDTKELGEVIDMVKDLYEAKEKMIKGCYYKQIMEAMEDSEYGEDYNEYGPMEHGRRGYRGQPRDSMGRYRSRRRGYDEMMPISMNYNDMEQMRDMDRDGMHRMYYSGSGSGSSGGNSGGSYGGNSGGSSSGSMSGGSRNYGGESGGRDYREGRSGQKRRSYMETKEMHQGNTAEDKQKKMKELEAYMTELGGDITEMVAGASQEEKNLLKTKLQTLAQKIS